ncbi:MAG: hydroxyacylglutathione hydrolase [bacterium]|jgi:hydroxyacylglutathione hydrolase
MKVVSIPCFSDNYSYLIICEQTKEAAIVDPGELAPVMNEVKKQGVNLVAILNTHHHWDHVGANVELAEEISSLKVYGFKESRDQIPQQNQFLNEGDFVTIGDLEGEVIHNPGHTLDAISYLFENSIFTGDTLFSGGCGRLFEGTPEMMHNSMQKMVEKTKLDTKVYFGHEYTESNLQFAKVIEPKNKKLLDRLEEVKELRTQGKFTTPSIMSIELSSNPFLRCDQGGVIETAGQKQKGTLSSAQVFKIIREMKNHF